MLSKIFKVYFFQMSKMSHHQICAVPAATVIDCIIFYLNPKLGVISA